MGIYYYWIHHKLKIGILLGRSISGGNSVDDVEPLLELKNNELFASDLYVALEEKELAKLSVANTTEILKAASGFLDLTMIDDKYLYAYVFDKLLGKGEIISGDELGKYKSYKIYGEE